MAVPGNIALKSIVMISAPRTCGEDYTSDTGKEQRRTAKHGEGQQSTAPNVRNESQHHRRVWGHRHANGTTNNSISTNLLAWIDPSHAFSLRSIGW